MMKDFMNTTETIYANGNFTNVNEVHNNTQNMILSGFNQEGGKVVGNIQNLKEESLQNRSTTTGSSRGLSLGINSSGIPNSIGSNWSNTSGNRAYVDNQSTFIVGEGSNLTIGKAENTGGVIGKQDENSTLRINEYVGQDIQNYDSMRTTGGSIGLQTGNIPVSNIGYNQDTRDSSSSTNINIVDDNYNFDKLPNGVSIDEYWKKGIAVYNDNRHKISLEELKRMRNRKYKYITNALDTDVYVKPFRLERKGY